MRYIAVDLGDARTGLAAGDALTGIVSPLTVLECPSGLCGGDALIDLVLKEIERAVGPGACELVVGLPMNMDGTEGPRARIVRAWAGRLAAKSGRKVHMQDERLTSAEADWGMARSGLTRGQKKARRDALAAAAVLRDFLASLTRPRDASDAGDEDPG
ncbi:MAG: Holliday junction resolvase RuvX [Phycisphaeraceae bacterium]|nr:MAG: Holliday junction resolvase RuvX [Phycisphaeraceae bacterium]